LPLGGLRPGSIGVVPALPRAALEHGRTNAHRSTRDRKTHRERFCVQVSGSGHQRPDRRPDDHRTCPQHEPDPRKSSRLGYAEKRASIETAPADWAQGIFGQGHSVFVPVPNSGH
jgi:hypothetical protein